MTVKQEKFLYAKIKDYEKRLKVLEKLQGVQSDVEAAPQAVCSVSSSGERDRQTEA